MKRMILCLLVFCIAALGCAAFSEAAPKDDTASMSAEELYGAGNDAYDARDYEKALEYYQKAAELGSEDAAESLNAPTAREEK